MVLDFSLRDSENDPSPHPLLFGFACVWFVAGQLSKYIMRATKQGE